MRAPAATVVALSVCLLACGGRSDSPPAISLVQGFAGASLSGSPLEAPDYPVLQWRFDGETTVPVADDPGPHAGWAARNDLDEVSVRDGRLTGTVSGRFPLLTVAVPEGALPRDLLDAVEVRVQASAGTKLGLFTFRDEEIDLDELLEDLEEDELATFTADFEPGDETRTVKLTERNMSFTRTTALRSIRHLGLILFGAEGGRVELESVRIIPRNEALASIESGIGWQGLGGIYRETVVSRSPERITYEVELGDEPWLDLAVGSPNPNPVTFAVEVAADGADDVRLRRTVTTADRWHPVALDLQDLSGRRARITLGLEAEQDGQVAFWGGPTVRHRGARPHAAEPTEARRALGPAGPPRGVILIVADTLRSDHLDAWGYERPTAPFIARLAAEGTRMADNISQGTWTKVSVSSILSSLYATTHGIYDVPHRMPASVTTLAEAFREAGYATFHTSSVTFTGRNSNLQQGVEVLHERASIEGLDGYNAKTARTYVDRVIPWLESHSDQPFFVFLHVFDPHSPFRPFDPYDRRWLTDEEVARHEEDLKHVDEVVDVFHNLPSAGELREVSDEVDSAAFLEASKAWYDGSIRAMDVEIARLVERLEELGLADDTLIAFVSDHGEEFHEHGESWHGHSVYGDMINVPMAVRWPGVVPAGRVIGSTTQSIDLMPTLLELAQIPIPEQAQGRSLVPLMAAGDDPSAFGWRDRPVFSERRNAPDEEDEEAPDAYTVIHDGWKLIWNVVVNDDRPEMELFDHRADPVNMRNVAEEHPERVAELKRLIEAWRITASEAKVSDEGLEESLSPEEMDELRALGYLN